MRSAECDEPHLKGFILISQFNRYLIATTP